MDDLPTRLRAYRAHDATADALLDEAAAEIERLAALWAGQTALRVRLEDEARVLREIVQDQARLGVTTMQVIEELWR